MISASPLRWAVIVVFVLGGVLILSKGFGGSSAAGTGGTGGTPSGATTGGTPTHSPTHTPTHHPTTATTPPLTGITVAIYNSTATAGLAGNERQKLETDGWDVISIQNTSTSFTTTTIYYESGAKAQAEYMKATYYPKADVLPAVPAFSSAKISLILGSDFVATP
jgi:hypothetical protein